MNRCHVRVFCLRCSYPLEGLDRSRCPECGRPFHRNDRRTFARHPRLQRLRRRAARAGVSLVFISMILGVVLVVTHVAYPAYVEARFAELLESLEEEGAVRFESSRCLGKSSEKIQLVPIFRSWSAGCYPFPLSDPKAESYMSCMYYHGKYFNYSKHLNVDGEDLITYWSIRENKWHVGNFDWVGRFCLVWRCACMTSRSPSARG